MEQPIAVVEAVLDTLVVVQVVKHHLVVQVAAVVVLGAVMVLLVVQVAAVVLMMAQHNALMAQEQQIKVIVVELHSITGIYRDWETAGRQTDRRRSSNRSRCRHPCRAAPRPLRSCRSS